LIGNEFEPLTFRDERMGGDLTTNCLLQVTYKLVEVSVQNPKLLIRNFGYGFESGTYHRRERVVKFLK